METFPYIIAGIGVILAGAGVFYVRNFLEKKDETIGTPEKKEDSIGTMKKPWEQPSQPASQGYQFTPDQKRNAIIIAIIAFVIISIIGVTYYNQATLRSDSSQDFWSVLSVFPFWVIVLIPILASRKKKQGRQPTQRQNLRAAIIIGGAVLLILGIVVFWVSQ
ncbi:hypothetical protein ACFL0L_00945 [Patescibacteria group bacterium]